MTPVSSAATPETLPSLIIPINAPAYTIIRCLGRGGDGTVYEASLGASRVAIKVHAFRDGLKERAEAEAQVLQAVNGAPHVIRYRSSFPIAYMHYEDDLPKYNIHYNRIRMKQKASVAIVTDLTCENTYTMYIEPANRAQRITSFSCQQILNMGTQGLEALEDLHSEKGYFHGDLKPQNVTYSSETTILDFGSARDIEIIAERFFGASAMYRSPELVLHDSYGNKIDASIDLWSWGATLFHLYTGAPLIPADGDANSDEWVNDYLHFMVENFVMPDPTYIESLSEDESNFFEKKSNGYSLKYCPSQKAFQWLNYLNNNVKIDFCQRKKVPLVSLRLPLWKIHIYFAAHKKGETEAQATKVIRFLEPMFSYDKRLSYLALTETDYSEYRDPITAKDCLTTLATVSSIPDDYTYRPFIVLSDTLSNSD